MKRRDQQGQQNPYLKYFEPFRMSLILSIRPWLSTFSPEVKQSAEQLDTWISYPYLVPVERLTCCDMFPVLGAW